MRKIIAFFIISVLTTNLYSQMEASPGVYLQKASKNLIYGLGIQFLGAGIVWIADDIKIGSESVQEDNSTAIKILGSSAIIFGFALEIRGFWQIGKAGRLMESKDKTVGLYLNENQYGFGVALKF